MAERALLFHSKCANDNHLSLTNLTAKRSELLKCQRRLQDANELVDVIETQEDANFAQQLVGDLQRDATVIKQSALLSGPADAFGARLMVRAGSGGTEAHDFSEMLFGAYQGWCALNKHSFHVSNIVAGPEAGIRSAELVVESPVYGLLKSETGTHRFRRFSPHGKDAGKKRQTSFAQVLVYPIPPSDGDDDGIVTQINDADLKIDTMRSSGPGGQNVNKTFSAVRITHIPSGIAVVNQDERSQHRNKSQAMAILRGRLLEEKLTKLRLDYSNFFKEQGEATFSNQIRTWQYGPSMVKDHRTSHVNANIDEVFQGKGLEYFMWRFLEAEIGQNKSE